MRPPKRKRKGEEESIGGLEKKFINTYIGSGVFAKFSIAKGAYVCSYTGETISAVEGEERLNITNGPCYLYFFKASGKYLCVDGTMSSCIGKYINDDHKKPNCKVVLKGQDLAVYTLRDIVQGEELRYDYGDKNSFWRKKNQLREVLYDLPSADISSDKEIEEEDGNDNQKNELEGAEMSSDKEIEEEDGNDNQKNELEGIQSAELSSNEEIEEENGNDNQENELEGIQSAEISSDKEIEEEDGNDNQENELEGIQSAELSSDKEIEEENGNDNQENELEGIQSAEISSDKEIEEEDGNDNQENELEGIQKLDVSETESLDDTDNDPDFSLESDSVSNSSSNTSEELDHVADSSSDTSDIIPQTVFPALTMEIKSSTCVKPPSNKQKTVYRSHNEVSLTTDGALNRKTMITVQTSNNENGRKWDKTQYCLFCEKGYTNIRKHYLKSHKTEKEVQKILHMPMKSKERNAELTRLRNAGNYKHNVSVLKEDNGEFVVVARKSHDTKAGDYLPCDDCLGFFLKDGLWRHKQVCPLRKGNQKSRRVQADAALLLPASNAIHAGLKENVFGKMVRDEVTITARNDTIILKVGEKLYQKHGHLAHLYSHISQKMRELGRFLLCSRTQDLSINCLNDILRPEKFPLAVQSTKVLCMYNEVTNSYENPSLALKIGHLLKKCAKVAKSQALINGDVEQGSRADKFLTLCEDEWTDEISSIALQTLTRNKMNKGHLLPLSEDIMRLKKFLDQKTESLLETLHERFEKAEWELLNQMTLAQLVMFNRRRGGETQRMMIDAYSSRTQNKDCPQEVTESLSATERILLNTLSRVEIRGKRGRTVPVLLTQKAERCIELLLRWRDAADVAKDNGYVFPRPNYGSLHALRSADVLRTFSKAAGLTNPELITSTRLRKHVATVAQVLSLNKNDLDVMASFMGHDITVHRSFYRLPQETLQVARMGRLLTALNNGTVGHYSGKSLDEIPLDETAELSSDEEMEEENGNDNQENELEGIQSPESDTDHPPIRQPQAKPGPSTTRTFSVQPKKLQKLSDEQSRLLKTLFKTNIALRKELRREDCEKVISKYEVLHRLSWKKIKNTIHNWITCEKRKTKRL